MKNKKRKSTNSKTKNLLVVSWHSTMPQHTGSNVRIRNLLLNFDEINPILLAPEPGDAEIRHLPFRPFSVPRLIDKMVPFNLEIMGCIGKRVAADAFEQIKDYDIAGVQCEHLWTFPLAQKIAKRLQAPLILIEHNIETLYTERMYGLKPLTKFARWYEKKALEESDIAVVCSNYDRNYLVENFAVGEDKVWVVPNGVSLPDDSLVMNGDGMLDNFKGRRIAMFLGKTSYSPNSEAISIIENKILPEVRARDPNILFVIVGGPAERDLTRLEKGIVYTGFVESVQPYLHRADICIAPLQSGSGTRLKILEYASYQKPIVATQVAAEGLELTDEKEIFIRDDWQEFSQAILSLNNDSIRSQKMGKQAYLKIKEKYQWQAIAQNYERQLLGLLS